VLALAAAVIGVVVVISGGGGGGGGGVQGEQRIAVSSATDYDPEGDGDEHSDEVQAAVDGNQATAWTTETYVTGPSLEDSGKGGVGLYLDAGKPVAARSVELRSADAGWDLVVYGAADTVPEDIDGWTELGSQTDMKTHATVQLKAGGAKYRYYLLWITKLASTDDGYAVAISDARLFS
jgi:eukaryotic-like serine/threonine-protein kinase